MMCSLEGTSITICSTPQSSARLTSSTMQRENANTRDGSPAAAIRRTASASCGETAGRPASIRCTPASASFSAIATFSSALSSTPACCSPSRSVTSWNSTFAGSEVPSSASGSKFHGLTKWSSVFHGLSDTAGDPFRS